MKRKTEGQRASAKGFAALIAVGLAAITCALVAAQMRGPHAAVVAGTDGRQLATMQTFGGPHNLSTFALYADDCGSSADPLPGGAPAGARSAFKLDARGLVASDVCWTNTDTGVTIYAAGSPPATYSTDSPVPDNTPPAVATVAAAPGADAAHYARVARSNGVYADLSDKPCKPRLYKGIPDGLPANALGAVEGAADDATFPPQDACYIRTATGIRLWQQQEFETLDVAVSPQELEQARQEHKAARAEYAAIPDVAASDLYAEYRRNEVAADERYRGRTLSVTGVVTRIGKDFRDRPFLNIQGGDSKYDYVQARFGKGQDTASIARTEPGESVTVICRGDGMLVNTPQLDCSKQ
ncbi:OB-fold putative lipoprotein [Caballeronia novacaledonica]|uniref:Uncharacterized protein n=1 Tax=Caballeronia novacaledonica TaxID=1544861 RepID=A0AA37IG81_9BURK|nr:OB-fold putative lipoprotein [Caballeronia novacaledonica]GJH28164.1 hypothetical protein CBA19CS42_26630 [Caballeronia novacaledonica]